MSVIEPSLTPAAKARRPRRRLAWLLRTPEGLIGFGVLVVVLVIAVIGPYVAPHALDEPIGAPGDSPSGQALLGTDFLGRDVLSRVLFGGMPVLTLALVTIGLTYLIGIALGMAAGLSRSWLDPVLMRAIDLFQVFPPLLLLLLLIAGAGSGFWVLIIGIVLVLFPGVARLVRTSTLEVSTTGYIEAAIVRGEGRLALMTREVLPNILPAILADLGVRFRSAIILAASVNFLGLGSRPPAANWGLMVAENIQVLGTNVWGVLAPAILLAALTISVNLIGDAYVDATGQSGGK